MFTDSTAQNPNSATMTKSRQTRLHTGVKAVSAASQATVLAVICPALVGLVVLMLLALAVRLLSHLQLWISGAGLLMVAISVAIAVQELKGHKSTQEYLSQSTNKSLPHVSPVKSRKLQQEPVYQSKIASMALNIASPGIPTPSSFPTTIEEESRRRDSEASIGALESARDASADNSAAEVQSKLDVLHCGTVIDIQGSQGLIIPHNLCVDVEKSRETSESVEMEKNHKMPLVIPFNLNENQVAVQQAIAVGKTVEFAFSEEATKNNSSRTMCALNVTPVPTKESIVKNRSALQSCKQAREVSFARAMEALTMISPRNVPVKHHVDLIKYAEKLDEYDTSFDQYN